MSDENAFLSSQSTSDQKTLVCSCEKSMQVDAKRLSKALGEDLILSDNLCRSQIARFESALDHETVCVACTQEAPLFSEVAEDLGYEGSLTFVNIRERAGWSDSEDVTPKMAALIKDAARLERPTPLKAIESEGICLVYGEGQEALDAATKLAGRLSVSVLLTGGEVLPPSKGEVPLASGRIRSAAGHLGNFEIIVDDYAPLSPSSRGEPVWLMPRNGASSTCDIIIDMSGGTAFFAGAHRRDGYIRVNPNSPAAIAEALFEASDLVGSFEKPIYVDYDPAICAHSRNKVTGCSKCLDVCPAGAISENGDHVAIDAGICGGCGSCVAVCPSGASSYNAPARDDLVTRIQALSGAFLEAGGKAPALLVHDESHGQPLIDAMARFGRGLPASTIPLSLHSPTLFGHEMALSALSAGFQSVSILANPAHRDELAGLEAEIELANAFTESLGLGARMRLIEEADPDRVQDLIWATANTAPLARSSFTPTNNKRETVRNAVNALTANVETKLDIIQLPENAPYGQIKIDTEGCTLCLACVSVCPANALLDNAERPEVRFVEAACLQCGLCQKTCPESVITLDPRYNLTTKSLSPTVLNTDEPFNCVSCGKPFGSRQTVERISQQLAGKHAMFMEPEKQRLIQMCDDCRVTTQFTSKDNPFAMGERPRIRTTEDYVAAAKGDLAAKDFLIDDE